MGVACISCMEMLERTNIHPMDTAACKPGQELPMQTSMDISAEQAAYTRPSQTIIYGA